MKVPECDFKYIKKFATIQTSDNEEDHTMFLLIHKSKLTDPYFLSFKRNYGLWGRSKHRKNVYEEEDYMLITIKRFVSKKKYDCKGVQINGIGFNEYDFDKMVRFINMNPGGRDRMIERILHEKRDKMMRQYIYGISGIKLL